MVVEKTYLRTTLIEDDFHIQDFAKLLQRHNKKEEKLGAFFLTFYH